MYGSETDSLNKSNLVALREGLAKLGWEEHRNLRLYIRAFGDDAAQMRAYAAELVSLTPDVILALSAPATKSVQEQTQSIPIVFVYVGDPVDIGIVKSIARPEGNATGFTNLFPSIAGKWIELLQGCRSINSKGGINF